MFDSCLPLLGKHISLGYMIILMAMDGTEIINEINIYVKRRQTACVINDSTLFSLLMHGLYNQNSSTSTSRNTPYLSYKTQDLIFPDSVKYCQWILFSKIEHRLEVH